jgi:GNAT superfamily N-acetyltransferase
VTDHQELHAAQHERWQELDPLLPAPAALVDPQLRTSYGVGTASFTELDPTSTAATWTALRVHQLTAQVAGPDPAAALADLLDAWVAGIEATPGDDDTALWVDWPSRDAAPLRALVRRGFHPAVVIAARRTGGASAVPGPGVTVRPLTERDVDAAVALDVELVRFDQQFGCVTERESTAEGLRRGLDDRLGRPDPLGWVAEQDGRVVGVCTVVEPERAAWIGERCAAGPAGYLESMVVTRDARSAGIGAALAARADRALAAAGVRTTVLHHSPANPLSTPFWYRQGYRPLWTGWVRRPALLC